MAKEKTEFFLEGGGGVCEIHRYRHRFMYIHLDTVHINFGSRSEILSQIKILRDNACYMYVGNAFCIIQDFSSWIFNPL